MLTTKEILSMTDGVIETMRKAKARKDAGVPNYHSTYAHSVEMKEAIEIHAIIGKKPDTLLAERYPNQTPEEFKYGLGNYQQTTVPVFLDTVHTCTERLVKITGRWITVKVRMRRTILKSTWKSRSRTPRYR